MTEVPDSSSGELFNDGVEQFPHISTDQLLLFVDDELPIQVAARIGEHLRACWSCRTRRDQIDESIANVVNCRNFIVKPYLPFSKNSRVVFSALLKQHAEKIGRPSLLDRLLGALRSAMVSPRRAIWISLTLTASICVFLLAQLHFIPAVSASEFLQRAETSDANVARTGPAGVVYQKVRITTLQKTVEREVYRDVREQRRPKHQPVTSDISPMKAELEKAGVNWDNPLSAASFKDWRSHQESPTDRVRRTGDGLMTLTTTAGDSLIKEESLTIRQGDFHPVKRTVETKNQGTFEIDEVNYAVLNWTSVNEGLFEPITPVPPQVVETTELMASVPVRPISPTSLQLDDAEMAARFALHQLGADLGDPVRIYDDNHNKISTVVIQGVVSSVERKQELLKSFSDIPYIKVDLKAEEEVAAQTVAVRPSIASASTDEAKPISVHSPIEKQLQEYFGSPDGADNFSKRALIVTDSIADHAWALRHLDDRYPDFRSAMGSSLSASSRELLKTMIHDHHNSMREETTELRELLKPFLLTIATSPAEIPTKESLFDSAQKTKRLALYLLFGSEMPAVADIKKTPEVAGDLLIEINQLEQQLNSQK